MLRLVALILFAAVALAAPGATAQEVAPNTCVDCHEDLLEQAGPDVHRHAGFTCVDCHGGNPALEEQEKSMDPAAGFIGKPKALEVAKLCAKCHSDIERMRGVNPRLPTDQFALYLTSHHGKLAEQGNEKVATCVSCHGAHGVKSVQDPLSLASKGRIVETCTGCHNAKYMQGVSIPTDQLEKYRDSVHGQRRMKEQDPSAPACNDCHGNHGAAPPGVAAITHVCGTCHATQAELFEGSSHARIFRERDVPPCTTCHRHHDIEAPTDALLGTGPRAACRTCHQPGDPCDLAAAAMRNDIAQLETKIAKSEQGLARAERLGMEVERPTYDLAGARDALVRARVVIHAFSMERFAEVIAEGSAISADVEKAAEAQLDEYAYRRKGLAIAAAVFLVFAGLLALKAHRIEVGRSKSEAG